MARLTNLSILGGFTPVNAKDSDVIEIEVASAYGTDIIPGDPVIGVTAGGVQRTPAGSAAAAATDGITGVCIEIVQYKDPAGGFVRRNAKYLPASTTWSAHQERSLIKIVLATEGMRFLCKVNAAAASLAVARALRFANFEHLYSGADNALGISGAKIALSSVNTTALQWRNVIPFTDMPFNDPLVADFAAEFVINKPYALPILGESTTGV